MCECVRKYDCAGTIIGAGRIGTAVSMWCECEYVCVCDVCVCVCLRMYVNIHASGPEELGEELAQQ
jgi:hypothetical protein